MGYAPGIPVDFRLIPLNLDPLLGMSFSVPRIWISFIGILDASGRATPAIRIPAKAGLAGSTFYTAFVTVGAGAPPGIRGVSKALALTILP